PQPPSQEKINNVIYEWTNDFQPNKVEESGCAVCGQLKLLQDLTPIKNIQNMLHILEVSGVTRAERTSSKHQISELQGPIIDHSCDKICGTCREFVRQGKVPRISLANGLWLGEVPIELKRLNYMERMLIQKVRTNCSFISVSSGMKKMISHIIAFDAPTAKVYHT
ncbi:hypothetical protein K435DRAFT_591460, partial [Dendrothele bispora CBS 962.96]